MCAADNIDLQDTGYRNDSANETRSALPGVVHEAQTILDVPPTLCLQFAESGFKLFQERF